MEKNIFIKIFRVNTAEYGTGPHLRYLCRVPVPGTGTDTEYGTGTYICKVPYPVTEPTNI